jgi:hypothetical protein
MLVLAVWTLCGSVGALLGGSMLAGLGSTLTQMGADAPEELGQVAAAGGAFGISGILLLVVAVAYLIVSVGVLQRKQWSRMGTVIVNGIYVVVALLGMILAGGFNILTLVLVIISAAIAFLFYTNGDIKATLTN